MDVIVTTMSEVDIPDVARLASVLGYPSSVQDVSGHFRLIRTDPFQEILVARMLPDGPAVGWIHVYRHLSIATGPRSEIGGVVVDESLRSKGIGTLLMSRAEEWSRKMNLSSIRFTSRTTRTEAHRLYARLGYQVQKTSHVFNKVLV